MRSIIITYEEVQKVIPVLKWMEEKAPLPEARRSAGRLLWELRTVKPDVNYLMGGEQLFLSSTDLTFLTDILEQLGLR